ncbi:hypothetical protein PRUPE_2G261800 [Prunus persica]|uniref:Phosphoglucan phosphatase LSF2, chloroplastic n=1 Tax=Prunus persica TaxID=3760 RepID=A0A251QLT8_PRUPE|nr:hypothetical protein PRUPE_2G261800 [Prunus persica]
MASVGNSCFGSVFIAPFENDVFLKKIKKSPCNCFMVSNDSFKLNKVSCGIEKNPTSSRSSNSKNTIEEYNTAMKRMMRNPYEYHHDLGMNYTLITDDLIVGSQPQKPEDIDHLKEEENVAYILNLQQDKDVEYWGIDLQSIIKRCKELGIRHMRRPLNAAYDALTSKRPCGPNKRAIRGATYDLTKNDPWKESFENLPEYAFEDIADWERNLIRDHIYSLRGT